MLLIYIYIILIDTSFFEIGDWGLGIGDWGLGVGPKTPTPKPKTPKPKPPIIKFYKIKI